MSVVCLVRWSKVPALSCFLFGQVEIDVFCAGGQYNGFEACLSSYSRWPESRLESVYCCAFMCACTLPPHCARNHDPCDLFAMRRVSQTGKAEHSACPRGRLGAPALQGVSLCTGVRLAVQRLLVASAFWLVRVGTPAHSLGGRSSAAAWRAMLWDENCDEDAFDAFPDSDDEVLFCFHRPSRVPVIACSRFLRNSFSSQALLKQSSLKGAEHSASVVFLLANPFAMLPSGRHGC